MTIDELKAQLENAAWFARCGQFAGETGAVPFATVAMSHGWDWLRTSREQADPVHGDTLIAEAEAAGLGESRRSVELAIAKLSGLRAVPDHLPALADGPHDLTPAAKGGAVFAARMAARELLVGRPGFWARVPPTPPDMRGRSGGSADRARFNP